MSNNDLRTPGGMFAMLAICLAVLIFLFTFAFAVNVLVILFTGG